MCPRSLRPWMGKDVIGSVGRASARRSRRGGPRLALPRRGTNDAKPAAGARPPGVDPGRRDRGRSREFLADHHPARVAEVVEDLGPGEGDAVFGLLEPRRAEVMSYLEPETQVRLVEAMPPSSAAELLHLMSHDERADLVNRLDEDRVDEILRQAGPRRARGHPPPGQLRAGHGRRGHDDRLRHPPARL